MKCLFRKRKPEEKLPRITFDSYLRERKRWYDEWITFKGPEISSEFTPYMSDIERKEWIYKETCHRKTKEKIPYYLSGISLAISALLLIKVKRQK